MPYKKRIFLTSFIIIQAYIAGFGQVSKSPFSTFGLGDIYNRGLAQNQGMGGLGISNPSNYYINNQNPALLVYNHVTSFQGGIQFENRTVSDGTSSVKNGNGNMTYLVLAFPVKPGKWTTSIGLMPYSSVNFKLTTLKSVEGSTINVTSKETGSGGLNQVYWSNGVRLHKYVSVGLRISHLFSSIINETTETLGQTSILNASTYERNYLKGVSFSGGISFHKDSLFKKNYRINVGLIYDLKSTLDLQYRQRIDKRSLTGIIVDSTTVAITNGTVVLPQSYGAGISFGRVNHWTVGADVTVLDYKQFSGYTDQSAAQAITGYKSAVGFEITPDITGFGNYLKRMTYRTGVSYDIFPYLVNGNQVKDFGINFGVSLPVAGYSSIDLSLKIGNRGNISKNTIDENYFRLYFGMTFNDRNWFIKRKFD